jgi:hypothetical protein
MTAFPWNPLAEELEHAAQPGEPSHVHIPRPSRQRKGHSADTSLEDCLGHGACVSVDD